MSYFASLDQFRGAEFFPLVAFSDDIRLFARQHDVFFSGHGEREILYVWDAITGSDVCTVPLSYKLTALTFLPGAHILVTASDPNPHFAHSHMLEETPHIPHRLPLRKPVAKEGTRAIIEFWDISDLIWHADKVNLFPRKTKTYYLEGADTDVHYMITSPDGKLLYMRVSKPDWGDIPSGEFPARGYIFSLDSDGTLNLPAEIRLDDSVNVSIMRESPPPVRNPPVTVEVAPVDVGPLLPVDELPMPFGIPH